MASFYMIIQRVQAMHVYYAIGFSNGDGERAVKDALTVVPSFAGEVEARTSTHVLSCPEEGTIGVITLEIPDGRDVLGDIWGRAYPQAFLSAAAARHYFTILESNGYTLFEQQGGSDEYPDPGQPQHIEDDIPFQEAAEAETDDAVQSVYKENLRLPFSPKLWGQRQSEGLAYDWRENRAEEHQGIPELDIEFTVRAETEEELKAKLHEAKHWEWMYRNRMMPVHKRSFTLLFPHLQPGGTTEGK